MPRHTAGIQNNKEVILYKAGRTPEGKLATAGHTASVAGDYMVCEPCATQAGAVFADNIAQFEGLLMLASMLHGKKINDSRLAAVSGAGFEAVAWPRSWKKAAYRFSAPAMRR